VKKRCAQGLERVCQTRGPARDNYVLLCILWYYGNVEQLDTLMLHWISRLSKITNKESKNLTSGKALAAKRTKNNNISQIMIMKRTSIHGLFDVCFNILSPQSLLRKKLVNAAKTLRQGQKI